MVFTRDALLQKVTRCIVNTVSAQCAYTSLPHSTDVPGIDLSDTHRGVIVKEERQFVAACLGRPAGVGQRRVQKDSCGVSQTSRLVTAATEQD